MTSSQSLVSRQVSGVRVPVSMGTRSAEPSSLPVTPTAISGATLAMNSSPIRSVLPGSVLVSESIPRPYVPPCSMTRLKIPRRPWRRSKGSSARGSGTWSME